MAILSGTISYGETRKIADYENKTGKVELTFAVDEGNEAEAAIDAVIEMCKAKLHSMLHGFAHSTIAKPAAKAVEAPKPSKTVEPTPLEEAIAKTEPAADDEPVAVPKRGPGRPKGYSPKVTLTPAGPKPEAKEFTPDPAEPETFGTPAYREVTDEEVVKACSERNKVIKNPAAIKELMLKFGVEKGQSAYTMPKEKRGDFIDALSKLEPVAQAA